MLTSYAYDQFAHLTQVAMARSTANGMKTQTRTFAYTSTAHTNVNLPALWLTSATNPESGTVSYTYNSVSSILRLGQKILQPGFMLKRPAKLGAIVRQRFFKALGFPLFIIGLPIKHTE